MLYANNLQHGFFIDSFALSRCAILDSPTIDKISAADHRGDAAKGEYGHLRVRFLIIIFLSCFFDFSVSKVISIYLISFHHMFLFYFSS
jgi:hypothetical protein